jgi:hypothetical protein
MWYRSMKFDPVSSVITVALLRTLPLPGTTTYTEEDMARNDSVILCYGVDTLGGGPLIRHTLPTQKYAARINIWKLISWNVSCETFRKCGLYRVFQKELYNFESL